MVEFRVQLLMLLATGAAIVFAEECCMPGQVLIGYSNFSCISANGARDRKHPISLKCKVSLSDHSGYFVNDKEQLQYNLPNHIVTHDPNTYCTGLMMSRVSREKRRVALICDDPEGVIPLDVFKYCMLVSAIFLIATAARYALRPSDILSKSIINLCMSLAFALFVFAYIALVPYSDMNWCAVRGFSAYYFTLVSFFWMHSIAIQILLSIKPSESDIEQDRGKRFIWFSLYSWGVPAVFTFLVAFINFMPGDHLKPGIGLNHCWFFDTTQQWEYMYSIMSVLTLANIMIFVAVSVYKCRNSHNDAFKIKFARCLQLFIVMGIPWIFEMIDTLTPYHFAWELIDLFNALQGVWIFLVLALFPLQLEEEELMQYKVNIISSESPYSKLEKW